MRLSKNTIHSVISLAGCDKRNASCWLAVAVVLLYTLYRFTPAFYPGFTLANTSGPSDGMGTTSQVAFMEEQYHRKGLTFLTTTFMSNEDVGAGLIHDAYVTLPWKWTYLALGSVLSPDNVYDGILALAFLFNALAGAFVARVFGLKGWHSYAAGLLFAILQAFDKKAEGHLGLAVYFVSLAQIAWAKIAITRQDMRSFFVLGIVSALAFVQNEYYGFFGSIFTAVFLLSRYVLAGNFRYFHRLLVKLALAGLSCLAVMLFFYFRLFFPENPILSVAFSNAGHSVNAFEFYSVKEISEVFKYFPFSHEVLNPESVYAIGSGMLVLCLVLLLMLRFHNNMYFLGRSRGADVGALFLAGVIMFLVASDFNGRFALGPVVYLVGPMFRVLLRALLFVDFALLIIFISLLAATIRCKAFNSARWAPGVLMLLAFLSVNGLQPLHSFTAYAMPDNQIYGKIDASDGSVLSLPFYGPDAPPEASYIYLYHYINHRRPLINGPFYQLSKTDPLLGDKLTGKTREINALTNETVKLLANAGVGAIVLERGHRVQADVLQLQRDGVVRQISHDEQGRNLIKLFHRNDGDFLFDFLVDQPYHVNMAGCAPVSYINGKPSSYCNSRFAIHARARLDFSGTVKVRLESDNPILISDDLGISPSGVQVSRYGNETVIAISMSIASNIRNNRKEIYLPLEFAGSSRRVKYEISVP